MGERISILGAGAWGRALYMAARASGAHVVLWGRDETPKALPHFPLPQDCFYTNSLKKALEHSPWHILALPVQSVREVLSSIKKMSPQYHGRGFLLVSKGMERDTGLFLGEVVQEFFPHHEVAALGGPNIAQEVFEGKKAGATLGYNETDAMGPLMRSIFSPGFLLECSPDVLGIQIMGALKNVMALGYGFLRAMDVGENQLSTFLVKALQEIIFFAQKNGAKDYMSCHVTYAGIGDFVLSCTSSVARNAQCGHGFARHCLKTQEEKAHFSSYDTAYLTEGVYTVSAAMRRGKAYAADLPIMAGIAEVLEGTLSPRKLYQGIFNIT